MPVHSIERLERRQLLAVQVQGFVDELVAGTLTNATAMEFAPDGRLFVAQQNGALRVIKNGALLPTPFLSLAVDWTGERGLLGIAFDPNFATNQYVYVYHTVPAPSGGSAHNRVSRFTASGDVAAGGGTPILDLESLSATNHNGGAIHFGPDGKLYVAVGDNAVGSNAQTLTNRLGKILRINADGSIPTDNPFYTTATGANRAIWAYGLRNPFTTAFDPLTGAFNINDVGQNAWEEIDRGVSGANYGWPNVEGPETTPNPAYADPLFAYNHSGTDNDSTGNVIAGGAFYRRPVGATNPLPDSFDGDYFFADSGHGWIRWLDGNTSNSTLLLNASYGIVDLKVGPDGSLYYLTRGSDAVRRLRYTVTPPSTPDLATSSDLGVSSSDNLTSDTTPTFVGATLPNATVNLYTYSTNQLIGTGVADGSGNYSVTTSALTDGARFCLCDRHARGRGQRVVRHDHCDDRSNTAGTVLFQVPR
ncbi:MAG: PQQ-dependent sugar dehydrogenase [Tepidisphaeraceae bacterium]